ncbi:uncharacterized protein LOC129948598 [Eupeodes corollae]|uniref:uncharacterized protein LOC129948598 n=1 Tax=Eupeodes corollae TaxID=290404 RepID=UPI002493557F|nr:uncharacterized protein LOC129948598 [Eupeodes corollae]XP_055915712.1 uncharacterized protein LOC129948598 [Eupeodes corollae]
MSRNNSKTNGLRFLWIPGRKSHSKGRYNATKKRIDYSSSQKRNEQWSLGGTKNQRNLLQPEGLESSPSVSGLLPVSCAAVPSIASTSEMPALTENKFSVLAKIDDSYELPSPPNESQSGKHNGSNNHVSTSDLISDSTSNHNLKKIDEDLEDDLPSPPNCEDHHSDVASENSPHKKHSSINKRRSYNNYHPEVDINSIESVSESKLQYSDLDITDGVYSNSHNNKNSKRKNKKNKQTKNKNTGANEEEDEKIVKCLYYTLMCCECTIS